MHSACVVLLRLLRHQTDVGRRAHRLDVELTVLLDVLAPAQEGGGTEKMKKRPSKLINLKTGTMRRL
jgi:hypothetical protein